MKKDEKKDSKIQFTRKALFGLWQEFYLAQKMGKGLGQC